MKKISIIVPVYNRQEYLTETIQSVLNQTNPNFELLLIDDHSTDGSFEICTMFQKSDNRIIAKKRVSHYKGASVCRNEGLQLATGEYIIFLDSDDLLASYCLEQRINCMEKQPELDFAVFPMLLFHEKVDDLMLLQNTETNENPLDRFLNRDMVWVISGPIWKKQALLKINGLKQDLPSFQDMELHVKALCHNLSFKLFLNTVPDNFYRQVRTNAVSHKRDSPTHYKAQVELVNHLTQLLRQTQQMNETRKLLLANFLLLIACNWRFHLLNKSEACLENAMLTWNKALELDLVNKEEFTIGKKYIKFKFNMRYNRVKWLQNRIELRFAKKLKGLIWKKGTTQAKQKYNSLLKYPA